MNVTDEINLANKTIVLAKEKMDKQERELKIRLQRLVHDALIEHESITGWRPQYIGVEFTGPAVGRIDLSNILTQVIRPVAYQ